MQKTVLVIEDQKSMAMLICSRLEAETSFQTHIAACYSEAENLINTLPIDLCITNLNLPDAPNGEILQLLKKNNLLTVVLTGAYSDNVRQEVMNYEVADYVVKDGLFSIDYVVSSVNSLLSDVKKSIWIVSSQTGQINQLQNQLKNQRYEVTIFGEAASAVNMLKRTVPDLILVDTSGNKHIDHFKFLNEIRKNYSDNELPILALSDLEEASYCIKLLKYGVSELIPSNYFVEEFYLRIRKAIEQSLAYKEIQKISRTDELTGLNNRRYYFQQVESALKKCNEKRYSFVFITDIDHFKNVNDHYGHQKGDEAIIFVAAYLKTIFEGFITARIGGEEFVVFGNYQSEDEIRKLCEEFRLNIESQSEPSIDILLNVSGGLHFGEDSIDELMAQADKKLYQAKKSGRNKVC